MDQQNTTTFQLPDIDPDADEQFRRTPQGMAIVVAILGVMSFLALVKPMFWAIPIVGVALGCVSLYTLWDPEKIGRKAAIFGLILALFFGAWGSSRYFSRVKWLEGVAREKADLWLELVKEDRLLEAYELHLRYDSRVIDGTPLEEHYADNEYMEQTPSNFFDSPPLKNICDAGPDVEISFKGMEKYEQWGNNDDIILRYVANVEEKGQPKDLDFLVRVRRFVHPSTKQCGWSIEQVKRPSDRM